MKFNIPELGQRIRLNKKWTFSLFTEERNYSMISCAEMDKIKKLEKEINKLYDQLKLIKTKPLSSEDGAYNFFIETPEHKTIRYQIRINYKEIEHLRLNLPKMITTTLPKGVILVVDRIYIRKGANDYSSVTFKAPELKKRFWVKLEDANNLNFSVDNP